MQAVAFVTFCPKIVQFVKEIGIVCIIQTLQETGFETVFPPVYPFYLTFASEIPSVSTQQCYNLILNWLCHGGIAETRGLL